MVTFKFRCVHEQQQQEEEWNTPGMHSAALATPSLTEGRPTCPQKLGERDTHRCTNTQAPDLRCEESRCMAGAGTLEGCSGERPGWG